MSLGRVTPGEPVRWLWGPDVSKPAPDYVDGGTRLEILDVSGEFVFARTNNRVAGWLARERVTIEVVGPTAPQATSPTPKPSTPQHEPGHTPRVIMGAIGFLLTLGIWLTATIDMNRSGLSAPQMTQRATEAIFQMAVVLGLLLSIDVMNR